MKLILGIMTFGEQIFGADAKVMIETFLDRGYREIDTAYVYNEGECEKILGNSIDEYMYKKIKLVKNKNKVIKMSKRKKKNKVKKIAKSATDEFR
mgnify:CR=1 FL=1